MFPWKYVFFLKLHLIVIFTENLSIQVNIQTAYKLLTVDILVILQQLNAS